MSFLVWKSFIMITGVRDRDGIPNFIRITSKNDVETVSFDVFMLRCCVNDSVNTNACSESDSELILSPIQAY